MSTPYSQSLVAGGLVSTIFSCPSAGLYTLKGKLSLPQLSQGASSASAVVVTIVNGTGPVTVYTGLAGAEGFQVDTVCALGDVLTITLSSSLAVDKALNAVKMTAEIVLGL